MGFSRLLPGVGGPLPSAVQVTVLKQTTSFLFLPYTAHPSKHRALGDPPASPPLSPATSTRQAAFQGQVPRPWLPKQAPGFMAICRICPGPRPGLPQASLKFCLTPTAFLQFIPLLEVSMALSSVFSQHQGSVLFALRLEDGPSLTQLYIPRAQL